MNQAQLLAAAIAEAETLTQQDKATRYVIREVDGDGRGVTYEVMDDDQWFEAMEDRGITDEAIEHETNPNRPAVKQDPSPDVAKRLAVDFSRRMLAYAGKEKMAGVDAANTNEKDGSICHSHDVCDPNHFMIEAYEAVTGGEVFAEHGMAEKAGRLIDAAWTMAKTKGFLKTATDGIPE